MNENYTAWDGNDYPWPPPDGWVLGGDGRYWPADQAPQGASEAPAAPPGAPIGQPPGAPPGSPSASAVPPPGAPPPTGPGAPAPAPPAGTVNYGAPAKKSSKAGWWILGILLAFLMVGVGGCVFVAALIANGAEEFGEALEEFEDDFTRQNEATQAISVASCSTEGGVPVASGTVKNIKSSESSFYIEIEFFESGTGQSLGVADVSVFDIGAGDTDDWRVSAPALGVEGAVQCVRTINSTRIAD